MTIENLIPMMHVEDVERSIRFYELLGFRVRNRMRLGERTNWAMLESERAELMLAAASGPIVAEDQAVLLYLYCDQLAPLRAHLLANGLADGGRFCGQPGPNQGRSVVFEPTYPNYMPQGEMRVADPDGYCLLIGALG